ncbi:MAG: ABC transporter ATP-binding protein [Rhizobiaceae bacterium]|nr:ABC transporter ATP-binding protein [Rhizobiaceae bacterium]
MLTLADGKSHRHEPSQAPLLEVRALRKYFTLGSGLFSGRPTVVQAVDGVSFQVRKGETLGIVGESGCGKSTMARLVLDLISPDEGEIIFDGKPVSGLRGRDFKERCRNMQMVFQDSHSTLNPRLPVAFSIAFGPMVQGVPEEEAMRRASELLMQVGLDPAVFAGRYSHELSGGQRQRVNIARALALRPRLVVLDEAVAALDKSIEAQVLDLLSDLKDELDLTYVFISHDLHVVRYVSDRVLVMYLGQVVETGSAEEVFSGPRHPYTQALFKSIPSTDPHNRTAKAPLSGDPPNPIDPPSGCRFRTRCAFAESVCSRQTPMLRGAEHQAACHMLDPSSGHSAAPAEGGGNT